MTKPNAPGVWIERSGLVAVVAEWETEDSVEWLTTLLYKGRVYDSGIEDVNDLPGDDWLPAVRLATDSIGILWQPSAN